MGRPKANLLIEGETLLDRQMRLLRSVARRVVAVGGSPDYSKDSNVVLAPDIVAGRGPLAGIYTALHETRTEFNLVLGCDLPFLNRGLLDYLAIRAIGAGCDVTVPRSREGRLQPLCAVYRRRALYAVRTTLAAGENKPRSFFPRVRCTVIPWQELARAGFQASIFGNMNTPEEYEYARRRIEGPTLASGAGFQ
jgi:molybdenum cofactor guanylyltransferase